MIRQCQSGDIGALIGSRVISKRMSGLLEIRKKKKLESQQRPSSGSVVDFSNKNDKKSDEQIEEQKGENPENPQKIK